MNKKSITVALMFALLLSVFAAIPNIKVSANGVPNPNRFTDATTGNIDSCDPAWAYDTASGELIFNVYEPLINFDHDKVSAFVPCLSDWWSGYGTNPGNNINPSSPDPAAPGANALLGLPATLETWYFHINTAIKWQDAFYGTVSARDVEYSFERGMTQDHDGGPQWMILSPLLVHGTTRYWNFSVDDVYAEALGHAIDDSVQSGIKPAGFIPGAPAGEYVWFNLRQKYSAFMQILAQTWACIENEDWVEDTIATDWYGFDATGYINWRDYSDPVVPGPQMSPTPAMMGTGPYYLDYIDIDPNVGWYRLEQFANYWQGWSGSHVTEFVVEVVSDDTTRLAMFTSNNPADQVDSAVVPRILASTLYGAAGVRLLKGLDTLSADAIFWNVAPDPISIYTPKMGGVGKSNLLDDRHMRLGLAYCVNISAYIETAFLPNEGVAVANPIIGGIRYYNASKIAYDQDLVRAKAEFQLAWGGQVWAQGFELYVLTNNNAVRKAFMYTLENIVETQIGFPSTVDIIPLVKGWGSGILPLLYTNQLPCWIIGWLADFPDPHNWMYPFMATTGDFSGFQNMQFGSDPATMNWEENTYGPRNGLPLSDTNPYYNYQGEKITEFNNTYVDGLIYTGITIPDADDRRHRLYEELMDIFHAECYTEMTAQPYGRHWERDWLQGWIYNPISPGYYVYYLWKEDVSAMVYDAKSTCRVLQLAGFDWYFDAHWYGTAQMFYIYDNITMLLTAGTTFAITALNGAVIKVTVTTIPGPCPIRVHIDAGIWLTKCIDTDLVKVHTSKWPNYVEEAIAFYGPIPPAIPVPPDHPPGKGWIRCADMTPIPNSDPTPEISGMPGDFNKDGVVNYKDASIFRAAYVTAFNAICDFTGDGVVNYKDAALFRAAYVA